MDNNTDRPIDFYSKTSQSITSHYSKIAEKSNKDIKEEVALKLKLYREENNLTLEQLASRVGVSKMQIIRWLAKRSKPSQLAMEKIKTLIKK